MKNYKYKSTIYLVFLIVSLLVNALFLYVLVCEYPQNKVRENEVVEPNYDVEFNAVKKVYLNAYKFINEDNNLYIPVEYKLNYDSTRSCFLVRLTGLEEYFTSNFIEGLSNNLIKDGENYYDFNNYIKDRLFNKLFISSDNNIKNLEYVMMEQDLMLVKYTYEMNYGYIHTSYMLLKKENENWLIEAFE